jgi:hypothetical protein
MPGQEGAIPTAPFSELGRNTVQKSKPQNQAACADFFQKIGGHFSDRRQARVGASIGTDHPIENAQMARMIVSIGRNIVREPPGNSMKPYSR